MNKLLIFTSVSFLFFGCGTKSTYEKIDSFTQDKFNLSINTYDYVVVINEQGECMECNGNFTKSMKEFIDHKNVLFLISCAGNMIDISGFKQQNQKNIQYDYRNDFGKLLSLEHCAIIDLKDGTASVQEINTMNLYSELKEFESNLTARLD